MRPPSPAWPPSLECHEPREDRVWDNCARCDHQVLSHPLLRISTTWIRSLSSYISVSLPQGCRLNIHLCFHTVFPNSLPTSFSPERERKGNVPSTDSQIWTRQSQELRTQSRFPSWTAGTHPPGCTLAGSALGNGGRTFWDAGTYRNILTAAPNTHHWLSFKKRLFPPKYKSYPWKNIKA